MRSLQPGRYFRLLFIGFFEGVSSERGIAWRVADSLSLRSFLGLDLTEAAPDHSTLSLTRRRIAEETHEAVFTWVLERAAEADLVRGKTIGIDATTLEANAAMRSIERRDTGESHEAFLERLAEASGIATPTRAELARFDRSRKDKTTSNKDWRSPQDPDAKIGKMKDGRTHLTHKVEHGVDMDTGAIVAVTVRDASTGDTATLPETLTKASEQVEAVQPDGREVEEVVADKDSPPFCKGDLEVAVLGLGQGTRVSLGARLPRARSPTAVNPAARGPALRCGPSGDCRERSCGKLWTAGPTGRPSFNRRAQCPRNRCCAK